MNFRTTIAILGIGLTSIVLVACGDSPPEQNSDGTWPRPSAWSEVPQNLLDSVYDQDPTASWWGRVVGIDRMLGSDDNYVRMRIRTDYRLNEPMDVIEATDLCNALVTSIPREGLQVSITGIITEGVTNADGTVETADNNLERITASESWKEGYPAKFCQARALFTDVIAEMRKQGWAQKYDDVIPDPAKVYEDDNWAQEGDIFFLDTGL